MGYGGRLVAGEPTVLLEREDEVGALETAAGDAAGGQGRLVVVAADGGLGKTRLLGVAAEVANGRDMHVLRARGTELERGFPFGVAIQLLRRDLERAEQLGLLSGIASLAAPLLDSEPRRADGPAVGPIVPG